MYYKICDFCNAKMIQRKKTGGEETWYCRKCNYNLSIKKTRIK